ncbi:MAG: ABC transporter ATP-binding protein [Candidatus Pelethousia sp.]|nr:ABC transporter ATP-binding protein [Candidatus Pelethousia sp.]
MDYFFSTKQLSVGYNGKPLIKDIEIRLQKGRILTLIGPNGSGKSTILRSITKQLKTIYGAVYIDGRSIGDMTNRNLSYQVSVVLTGRMRTELMTCQEVVETGRYPYTGILGILSEEDHAQVRAAMELVNVADLKDRDFMQISDGQRQRVLLARAICQQPQIIVLDEPTSFLDIRYELELLDTLRQMARERGIAVIMSLHELDLAQRISDDVMCVKGEYISHYGSAQEIFQRGLIHELYDLEDGSYNPLFGSLEMKRPQGEPRLFVIAGGGTGIEVYRALQKRQIPFFTGILHENDIDYQVARDLAAGVIAERSFSRITEAVYARALDKVRTCDTVLNCLSGYGEMNVQNRLFYEQALALGCRAAISVEALEGYKYSV